MNIFDFKRGDSAKIVSVDIGGAAGERLLSLGVKRGQVIKIIAFSLFSGSVLVSAGYNRVALRRAIADKIEVEKC